MLAPKISLSQLLWSMVGVAVFLALVSTAWRGSIAAFGLALAIVLLPIVFFVYSNVYWALYLFAAGTRHRLNQRQSDLKNLPPHTESETMEPTK